jgi:hypothetical protein
MWLALAALVITFGIVAVASFLPAHRLWGVNHLAFYPVPVRVLALSLIGLAFIPRISVGIFDRLQRTCERFDALDWSRGLRSIISVAVAAAVVFIGLRSATVLLGDGTYLLNSYRVAIAKGYTISSYVEHSVLQERLYPGTELLNFLGFYTAHKLGLERAIVGVRLLNCVVGGLFVGVLLTFVKRGPGSPLLRWLGMLLMLTSGAMALFFGYVESYTPLLLVGTLYVLLAWRAVNGCGSVILPGIVLVCAALLHVQALLLAPSFLLLIVWKLLPAESRGRVFPISLTLSVLLSLWALFAQRVPGWQDHLLGWRRSEGFYGVLSFEHLVDVLNLVMLVAPAALFFVVLLVSTRWRPEYAVAGAFSIAVAAPAALFLLFFRPELGMARDWDLYCFPASGLLLPALLAIGAALDGPRAREIRTLLVPAFALSAVLSTAWVGVNASAERSVARYERILGYDTTHVGYAYETLAKHHEEHGEVAAQVAALRRAYDRTANPRYLAKVGETHYRNGDNAASIEVFEQALAEHPDYHDARRFYIGVLDVTRDTDRIIEASLEGLRYSDDVPDYHFFLGKALVDKGQIEAALVAFERCRELDPPERFSRAMDAIMRQIDGTRGN